MSLSRYVLFVILVTGDIPSEGAVTVNVYSEKQGRAHRLCEKDSGLELGNLCQQHHF